MDRNSMCYTFNKRLAFTTIWFLLCWEIFPVEAQSISYPVLRFVPWELNKALSAATALGYNSTFWDNPGTNPIEILRYDAIVLDPTLAIAIEELEINKQSWDCYINHYRGLSWPDLANTYKNSYRALGWTHLSWNNEIDPPVSDSFSWNMLNSEEQDAAETLCYFKELWDKIPIDEWKSVTLNLTAPPSSQNPTISPSTIPSPIVTTTPSIAPSTIPSPIVTATLSSSPSMATTVPSLTEMDTISPTRLVLSASHLPTILPSTQSTIPIPYFRYISWSNLNDDSRIFAILLGYTRETWDVPGSATIEHMSFDMIQASNESKRIVYIQALGFSRSSWDCFMTHFTTYDWDELSEYGVQLSCITLGWTEQLWNDPNSRSRDRLQWKNLNPTERIAAESLCYLEPTWNNASLQDDSAWRVQPRSSSSNYLLWFSWTAPVLIFTFDIIVNCH